MRITFTFDTIIYRFCDLICINKNLLEVAVKQISRATFFILQKHKIMHKGLKNLVVEQRKFFPLCENEQNSQNMVFILF